MVREWREAIQVFDRFRGTVPELDSSVDSYEAFAYKQVGETARARQLLSSARRGAEQLAPQLPSIAYLRATFAAVEGQHEDALEWLRRAVVERDSTMPFYLASVDPVFAELRADPRYLAITTSVTKAGLTPCQPPVERR
jgi:tetratricopeptide (TPR) repeat protein